MNYLRSTCLSILSLCLTLPTLQAQTIEKVSRMNYEYQGQVHNYKEMGSIFTQNEEAYAYFEKANKN